MGLRIAVVMAGQRADGGAEALFRTFAAEIEGSHQVELFTTSQRPPRHDALAQLDEMGIPHHSMMAPSLFSPRRLRSMVEAFRDFDVVQTHLTGPNIVGSVAARLAGVGSMAVLHNAQTKADNHLYHGRLEAFVLQRLPERVVAVGPNTTQARQPRLPRVTLHTLPNAVAPGPMVDVDEVASLRRELMTDPTATMVLSVGRLHEQKAHDAMIDAMVDVVARRPRTELVICGRGAAHDELAAQAADRGLDAHVHLAGSRPDVRRVMAAADFFVMPSRWEGLPVALLEAVEAGLPALVTPVGDIPSVLDDSTGFFVERPEADLIAKTLLDALDTADLDERAERARAHVRGRFGARAWADAMLEHLEVAADSRS